MLKIFSIAALALSATACGGSGSGSSAAGNVAGAGNTPASDIQKLKPVQMHCAPTINANTPGTDKVQAAHLNDQVCEKS